MGVLKNKIHISKYILKTFDSELGANIKIVPNNRNFFESKAIDQLAEISQRKGIVNVVGYPDLHPGKGIAVGSAIVSRDYLYPYLIGGDIGCGMGVWKTNLKRRKAKIDRISNKLINGMAKSIESSDIDLPFHESLGTIGGGNHFAELQTVERIFDYELAPQCGIDENNVHLLVHSGSRGYGQSILRKFVDIHKAEGIHADSPEGQAYLQDHNAAHAWAKLNREKIAHRVGDVLGVSLVEVSQNSHNSISEMRIDNEHFWIHRKGAAAADSGVVMIPGTRGSLSYLVQPTDEAKNYAWSLSHGAGRKWQRSECKGRLREKFRKNDLIQTELGSRVLCADKELLYEEAPQAYKNIETVIAHLLEAKLIRVIASFRPLITYKTGKSRWKK